MPGVAPAAKQMGARVANNILARIDGRETDAIPLHRLWRARDHRPAFRDRAAARLAILRLAGLVVLARAAHLFPDRVPQPDHRAHQLGLGLFHLLARSAHHSRQRRRRGNAWPPRRKHRPSHVQGRRKANARPKLAPNAIKRGLSATEVALALDHADIAAVVELVHKAGGAPLGAYREPLGRPPAAARVAAFQRGATDSVSARPFADPRQASGGRHRSHGRIPRSAHRGARRRRPLLDAERPPSTGRRQDARVSSRSPCSSRRMKRCPTASSR